MPEPATALQRCQKATLPTSLTWRSGSPAKLVVHVHLLPHRRSPNCTSKTWRGDMPLAKPEAAGHTRHTHAYRGLSDQTLGELGCVKLSNLLCKGPTYVYIYIYKCTWPHFGSMFQSILVACEYIQIYTQYMYVASPPPPGCVFSFFCSLLR